MKRVRLITVPRLGHLLSVGVDWVVDRVQLPPPARWLVFTIAVCQLGRTLLMRFAGVGPCTTQGLCWATIQGLCWAIYRDSTLPLYRDSARPIYRDSTRSLYRDYARPLYGDSARPLSAWFSQGLDRNELLGWNFCSFWTVLTLLQTCSRSCGVVSREELPAMGRRSQEGEEKEIHAY